MTATMHSTADWASGFDRYMVGVAARREPVMVERNGRTIVATLICWRPNRTNGGGRSYQARVEFKSGNRATVSAAVVTPVEAYRE